MNNTLLFLIIFTSACFIEVLICFYLLINNYYKYKNKKEKIMCQQTRPVAVYKVEWSAKNRKREKVTFLFNGFFHSFYPASDGDEIYTIALVEKEDGSVEEVDTEQIVFLDRIKKK